MGTKIAVFVIIVIIAIIGYQSSKAREEEIRYWREESKKIKQEAFEKRKEEEAKEKARRIKYLCEWLNSSTEEAEKFYFFITCLFDTEKIYGQYACYGDEQFYAFKFSTEAKKKSIYKKFLKEQEKSDE